MKSTAMWTAIGLILGSLALTGCESKQHKLQRLQAEYAAAYKQYQIDCVDPMSSGAADVVNKALNYVFSKDRDFQDFLKTPEAIRIVPTLRVRRAAAIEAARQPSRKPTAGVESTESVRVLKA